jgi:hypothetical protein
VRDQRRSLDFQPVEHLRDILGLGFLVVTAGRMRRQAHAAQIGHDNGVILAQSGRDWSPHIAGVAEAVQQHHRRSLPAVTDVNRVTGGLDVSDFEILWKSESLRRLSHNPSPLARGCSAVQTHTDQLQYVVLCA